MMGCPIEKIRVDMAEKDGLQVEEDMEENKAKKEVWTRMCEWKSTKVTRVHYELDNNNISATLACLVDMIEVLEVFFD